jgi:hypothetical protein
VTDTRRTLQEQMARCRPRTAGMADLGFSAEVTGCRFAMWTRPLRMIFAGLPRAGT